MLVIPVTNGHTCVVGLGWGDEGKGKIVDLLCGQYNVVVRFNGGANAGHTVCIGKEKFALHLLPSGVLHSDKQSVIGPGVVVDPIALVGEIDALADRGVTLDGRLSVSDRAHIVMPYHKLEDSLSESNASSNEQIGTTARGIGPCYADKMKRTTAIRVCDLLATERFSKRIQHIVRIKRAALEAVYGQPVDLNAATIAKDLLQAAERIRPYVCNTSERLHAAMARGDRILFEGANGSLLDVDHGTYPFVTSSTTTANGVASGSGVASRCVTHVLGIIKAYATRVGKGPFVTELNDDTGDAIRKAGNEFGTTTGRPRRCGWFDAVATRYSIMLSGVTELAVMHLDTLTGFKRIGICTGYRCDGQSIDFLPADSETLETVEPVVEWYDGWTEDLSKITVLEKLPDNARRYLDRLETHVGAPVTIVSVGPERSQTIVGATQTLNVHKTATVVS